MIPIAELVSLGQLVSVAGEPLWFFRVALYTEQAMSEPHAKQCINPLCGIQCYLV